MTLSVGQPHTALRPAAPPAPAVEDAADVAHGARRLHHVFAAACDACPTGVALECGGERLTYQELDERANRLAQHLPSLGVGDGARVAILLHRSVATYVALLAVGKAGAAFVPIDPESPADRVAYIAEDSGVDLLLTASELLDRTTGLDRPVLALDQCEAELRQASAERPKLGGDDDPLAYIIHTSGSSGRPKGVAVAQSSICNFLDVVPGVYDVRPSDRVYQGMTIAFDFSIEEIWPTWSVGATLVAGPTDSRRLGAELADFLDDAAGAVAAVSGMTWLGMSGQTPAGPQPLALIYRGPASSSGCSESVAALLRSGPTKFRTEYCGPGENRQISPSDLAEATVYVQPGGGEVNRAWRRLRDDSSHVRDFVNKGGTYLGFCLGAYLAAGNPGFGLLPGDVGQYIDTPGASTDSEDDTVIPITWRGQQRHMYFQDGPLFRLNKGASATVLATYNTSAPAAVVASYGSGRVGVVGPHLEADQGWYRDAHLTNPDGIRFDLGYDFVENRRARAAAHRVTHMARPHACASPPFRNRSSSTASYALQPRTSARRRAAHCHPNPTPRDDTPLRYGCRLALCLRLGR